MNYATQLTLGIRLQEDATFENFLIGRNAQLMTHLKQFLQNEDHFFYIGGVLGSGRSHLLQACCHEMTQLKQSALYLPLSNYQEFHPGLLENLETISLVCVDDIQCISQEAVWQESLMHLYNRSRAAQTKLIVSGDVPPSELALSLADLKSRLSWGWMYQLHLLADEDKVMALQTRAKERGFELSQEVGNFLLRRCARQMSDLFLVLEKLDEASLSAQRRLTIPFVKTVLNL
ncbi:MAG: DnaA regulatory inactivator Hda [Gammaproteobacteria bacterium]|nr:DnaA regulatory inactivator Hda [Gammaproteobacteria bacterium]